MILVRCRSFESIVFVSSLRSWGQILFQEFPRNGETTVSGQARDSIASSRKRKEQFLGAAILEGNYFQSVHQHLVAASRCKGNAVLRHRAWKFQGTRLLVRGALACIRCAHVYIQCIQGVSTDSAKRTWKIKKKKEKKMVKIFFQSSRIEYKRIWFILNRIRTSY